MLLQFYTFHIICMYTHFPILISIIYCCTCEYMIFLFGEMFHLLGLELYLPTYLPNYRPRFNRGHSGHCHCIFPVGHTAQLGTLLKSVKGAFIALSVWPMYPIYQHQNSFVKLRNCVFQEKTTL